MESERSDLRLTQWSELLALARAEVRSTLLALPKDLQVHTQHLPVTYERRPNEALRADGLEADTLGLFVGEAYPEGESSGTPLPTQIILFLENLWEFAGEDQAEYRAEVRTTLLHELGHYLGLDESDLETRDLS